ncbi:MAG: hypothetical protein QOH80_1081 [Actinomycetota bacterium]|nr:hypothetical protein [Actinomycetota bacterium]
MEVAAPTSFGESPEPLQAVLLNRCQGPLLDRVELGVNIPGFPYTQSGVSVHAARWCGVGGRVVADAEPWVHLLWWSVC